MNKKQNDKKKKDTEFGGQSVCCIMFCIFKLSKKKSILLSGDWSKIRI